MYNLKQVTVTSIWTILFYSRGQGTCFVTYITYEINVTDSPHAITKVIFNADNCVA